MLAAPERAASCTRPPCARSTSYQHLSTARTRFGFASDRWTGRPTAASKCCRHSASLDDVGPRDAGDRTPKKEGKQRHHDPEGAQEKIIKSSCPHLNWHALVRPIHSASVTAPLGNVAALGAMRLRCRMLSALAVVGSTRVETAHLPTAGPSSLATRRASASKMRSGRG